MKKTLRGFTLVECLVAMAILAIASTLMAEIYASVSVRNNFNHFTNTSLANQMAYIENYENAKTLPITNGYTGTTPPHTDTTISNSGTNAYVKVESSYKRSGKNSVCSFPVDIYVMYSRDTHDVGSNNEDGNDNSVTYSPVYSEEDNNLRYKYILGHTI